ncbi:protein-disulfide reductase DsbD family protein [Acuticoccus yangtzensis]|uniref:protein-disulfide reductase DsbD family protein n=1 Tax=Acuticoccus yangtzensis TaxID=1443441 RepID=UPI0009495DB2|nr:protein-disulfide reductase DsbD domain-containing protein [Acuticoccus yangtzensis]
MTIATRIACALILLAPFSASAVAATPWQEGANSAARLHIARDVSGDIVAGLEVRLEDGWKTYWRSAGSTGLPPRIQTEGSQNVGEARVVFPAPERFVAFGIEALGYEHGVTLPLRINLADPARGARLDVQADFLVCGKVCIPTHFSFAATIPADPSFLPAIADTAIAAALARVPRPALDENVALAQLVPAAEGLKVELKSFGDGGDLTGALIVAEVEGANPLIGKLGARGGGRFTATLRGVPLPPGTAVRLTVADEDLALDLSGTVTDAVAAEPTTSGYSLAAILAIAFLGGLILNVMPCVLPVLSIKVAALSRAAALDRGQQRLAFLATAGGIVTFIAVLAVALGTLKAFGRDVFWGMQFQEPLFVGFLFALLALMTLNLAGVFEIRLPDGMQNRLGRLGRTGDFADGFVIALLATPCSAPFLGTAIAFGLAGGASALAATFAALAAGFAFPYVLVAAVPGATRLLPKPGRWMARLQRALVVPMLAVVAWLGSILFAQVGVGVLIALATGSLAVAAVLRRPRPATVGLGGVVIAACVLVVVANVGSASVSGPSGNAGHWQPFDREVIEGHVARGHVVFVDVTADWCITCVYNKAAALDREPVEALLARPDTVAMRADWTRPDDAIAAFVKDHGRYGIPLDVAYGPAAPNGIVLPEILTIDAVRNAIAAARGRPSAVAQTGE